MINQNKFGENGHPSSSTSSTAVILGQNLVERSTSPLKDTPAGSEEMRKHSEALIQNGNILEFVLEYSKMMDKQYNSDPQTASTPPQHQFSNKKCILLGIQNTLSYASWLIALTSMIIAALGNQDTSRKAIETQNGTIYCPTDKIIYNVRNFCEFNAIQGEYASILLNAIQFIYIIYTLSITIYVRFIYNPCQITSLAIVFALPNAFANSAQLMAIGDDLWTMKNLMNSSMSLIGQLSTLSSWFEPKPKKTNRLEQILYATSFILFAFYSTTYWYPVANNNKTIPIKPLRVGIAWLACIPKTIFLSFLMQNYFKDQIAIYNENIRNGANMVHNFLISCFITIPTFVLSLYQAEVPYDIISFSALAAHLLITQTYKINTKQKTKTIKELSWNMMTIIIGYYSSTSANGNLLTKAMPPIFQKPGTALNTIMLVSIYYVGMANWYSFEKVFLNVIHGPSIKDLTDQHNELMVSKKLVSHLKALNTKKISCCKLCSKQILPIDQEVQALLNRLNEVAHNAPPGDSAELADKKLQISRAIEICKQADKNKKRLREIKPTQNNIIRMTSNLLIINTLLFSYGFLFHKDDPLESTSIALHNPYVASILFTLLIISIASETAKAISTTETTQYDTKAQHQTNTPHQSDAIVSEDIEQLPPIDEESDTVTSEPERKTSCCEKLGSWCQSIFKSYGDGDRNRDRDNDYSLLKDDKSNASSIENRGH